MLKDNAYISAIGRRKEAVARVRVIEGDKNFSINGRPINEYFKGEVFTKRYQKPFVVTQVLGKYGVSVKVLGGGPISQLDAVIHGISRALAKISGDYRTLLKREGLLTRDPRAKERRKYGNAQKARAKKQSPKR